MKISANLRRVSICLLLLAVFASSVAPSFGGQRRRTKRRAPAKPKVVYYTVPTNTVIRVRMNSHLNSRTARIGDRFSTNVTEPVYGGTSGVEVIPVGSKIWGRVASVRVLVMLECW